MTPIMPSAYCDAENAVTGNNHKMASTAANAFVNLDLKMPASLYEDFRRYAAT